MTDKPLVCTAEGAPYGRAFGSQTPYGKATHGWLQAIENPTRTATCGDRTRVVSSGAARARVSVC
jgi:hypothetical protein